MLYKAERGKDASYMMLLEGSEELDFLKLGTVEITDCLREELMVELGRESAQIILVGNISAGYKQNSVTGRLCVRDGVSWGNLCLACAWSWIHLLDKSSIKCGVCL